MPYRHADLQGYGQEHRPRPQAGIPEVARAILHPAVRDAGRVVPVQVVGTDTGSTRRVATGKIRQHGPCGLSVR